jgi:hypothetical protein
VSERGRLISSLSAVLRCGASAATGAGLLAKIGAGCGPDCMNSALIRMVMAAVPATTAAIESRGRRNMARSTNPNKINGKRPTDRPLNSSSFTRAVAARTDRLTPFF